MTWIELCDAIGRWSEKNFGMQESKVVKGLVLDSLAPLLGLVEEYFEFQEALVKENMMKAEGTLSVEDTSNEVYDAIADQAIYLIDFVCREGIPTYVFELGVEAKLATGNLGRLVHTTLKFHQGIRGVTVDVYRAKVFEYTHGIFCELSREAKNRGLDLRTMVEDTYESVVSKRDWKSTQ